MATTVKITTIGNSVGIVLPKEILNHLHVEKGDSLYITESPDGVQLSPYDVDLGRRDGRFKRVMRENRDVLKNSLSNERTNLDRKHEVLAMLIPCSWRNTAAPTAFAMKLSSIQHSPSPQRFAYAESVTLPVSLPRTPSESPGITPSSMATSALPWSFPKAFCC